MKTEQYKLYDNKSQLIGSVELDRVYKNEDSGELVVLAHDPKFGPYEISAWQVSRIINFSDPSMPSTYGKL